jgi:hypothetical protein
MKKLIYLFLSGIIIFNGCSKSSINSPDNESKSLGKLSINIDKTTAPANVATVTATLTMANSDTLTGSLSLTSDSTAGISFQNIPVGTWSLVVTAESSTGTILFSGQSNVVVNEGATTNVALTLNPIPNNTGSINIKVNWGSPVLGNAIYLDGATGYVQFPQSQSLLSIDTAITIEAWVKPVNQFYNPVFTLGQDYGLEFAGGLYAGLFLDGVNVPSAYLYYGRIMISTSISPNLWSHVAFSYSQSTGINVYINGNLVYQTQATGLITCSSSLLPRIGCRVDPSETVFFNGGIDEVRLWNIVRSQADISQNMSNELTGSESGLVAYWKFDEQPGSTVIHDATSNHNDGQIFGNAYLAPDIGN